MISSLQVLLDISSLINSKTVNRASVQEFVVMTVLTKPRNVFLSFSQIHRFFTFYPICFKSYQFHLTLRYLSLAEKY